MNLTRTLLNNPGLKFLTVPDEQVEIGVVQTGFSPTVTARAYTAELVGHKIVFAFFQDDFQGGKIAYWHVTDPTSKSFHSTLSMQGLRDWKVNMRAGRRR